jgi:hypothetical protein
MMETGVIVDYEDINGISSDTYLHGNACRL